MNDVCWWVPPEERPEYTHRSFIPTISSNDATDRRGYHQHKSANKDAFGMIAEVASGQPLRSLYADLVDAASGEGALWISTGRDGLHVEGCLTARDLARYGSSFSRRRRARRQVGSISYVAPSCVAAFRWIAVRGCGRAIICSPAGASLVTPAPNSCLPIWRTRRPHVLQHSAIQAKGMAVVEMLSAIVRLKFEAYSKNGSVCIESPRSPDGAACSWTAPRLLI